MDIDRIAAALTDAILVSLISVIVVAIVGSLYAAFGVDGLWFLVVFILIWAAAYVYEGMM